MERQYAKSRSKNRDSDDANPVRRTVPPHECDACEQRANQGQGQHEAENRQQVRDDDDPRGIALQRLLYARVLASWR